MTIYIDVDLLMRRVFGVAKVCNFFPEYSTPLSSDLNECVLSRTPPTLVSTLVIYSQHLCCAQYSSNIPQLHKKVFQNVFSDRTHFQKKLLCMHLKFEVQFGRAYQ